MEYTFKRTCSLHVRWLQDSKFLQQLAVDNIAMNIIEEEFKPGVSNKAQNRTKQIILNVLQCYPVQILIALLVLIDAGIIIAEIVLEIHSMKNKIEAYSEQMRQTIHILNRVYAGSEVFENLDINLLDEGLSPHEELDILVNLINILPSTPRSYYSTNLSACNGKMKINFTYQPSKIYQQSTVKNNKNDKDDDSNSHNHRGATIIKQYRSSSLHNASEMLHFASIAILSLFVIELTVKVLCIGPIFFKARFELLDAVVILTSFVADIVIVLIGSEEISVMIIFLLWRIVRVINGLIMHEKQRDEFRIYLQKKARRISELRLDELLIEKEMQEKHCTALEELCLRSGVSPETLEKCRPQFVPLNKCHTNNPLKSIAALTSGFMGSLVGAHATNRIMQKLTVHNNSPSPFLSKTHYLSPDTSYKSIYRCEDSDSKSVDTFTVRYQPENNIGNDCHKGRYTSKRQKLKLRTSSCSNLDPEIHDDYLIESFISSPVIRDDND